MSLRTLGLALIVGFPLAAFAPSARAEDLTVQAQQLVTALETAPTKLTDEQRENIRAFLDAARQLVEQAGGAAGPGACYNEAYKSVSRELALELCEGTGDHETVRCFREAQPILPVAQAVRLCRGGGSVRTFVCFSQAHRELSAARSVELCEERGTEETSACFAQARRALTAEQAVRLCRRRGSTERVACVDDQQRRLASDEAVEYCRARTHVATH